MSEVRPSKERCCQCGDDEAYKYGECFCLCHTRDHQPAAPSCYHCGPKEMALGKCKCLREALCLTH